LYQVSDLALAMTFHSYYSRRCDSRVVLPTGKTDLSEEIWPKANDTTQ
jgi:hypothetical protein